MDFKKLYKENKIIVIISLILVTITLTVIVIFLYRKSKNEDNSDQMSSGNKGGLNNPGNIRMSGINWKGKISKTGDIFESFDTLQNGVNAMYQNLLSYRNVHGRKTIREIISAWAPSSDNNNTSSYINFVSLRSGINPDAELALTDYPAVLSAMSKQEGNVYVSVNDVNDLINSIA